MIYFEMQGEIVKEFLKGTMTEEKAPKYYF